MPPLLLGAALAQGASFPDGFLLGGEVVQPPDLALKVLYSHRDTGSFLRRLSNEAQILQDLAPLRIGGALFFLRSLLRFAFSPPIPVLFIVIEHNL